MHRLLVSAAVAFGAALVFVSPRAEACGGCFAPPSPEVSVVTGHRMVFSINETRTVLWDQFEYSGSPEEFSWVLPVRPGAWVEESTDAWFEALDAFTSTQVLAPPLNCASGNFSEGGCGSSSSDGAASSGTVNPGGQVQVVHQGTVGPYETVTLSAEEPAALRNWLTSHGYAIPTEVEPIIDAYTSEGFDFVALRLQPNKGIQQMTPVRVVTPGGDETLPLRMVAAGIGSFVGITLFVIAEDRHTLPDLPEVSVISKDLVWDFLAQRSNYSSLRESTLASNGGRTFLTTFARQNAFSRPTPRPDGLDASFSANGGFQATSLLSELYFAQASVNDGSAAACPSITGALESSAAVVDGQPFECGEYTDIGAAMIGMRPSHVWLTRLEMNLPSTALDHDCVVAPAVSQSQVENWHVAAKARNAPCAEAVFSGPAQPAGAPLIWLGTLTGAWLGRRVIRRRKPR